MVRRRKHQGNWRLLLAAFAAAVLFLMIWQAQKSPSPPPVLSIPAAIPAANPAANF